MASVRVVASRSALRRAAVLTHYMEGRKMRTHYSGLTLKVAVRVVLALGGEMYEERGGTWGVRP